MERKHVLMAPFAAYGHIIPLLELGRKLARFNDVTFAVSAELVDQIFERELAEPNESVNFLRIPDGFSAKTVVDPTSSEAFKNMIGQIGPGIQQLITHLPALPENWFVKVATKRPVDAVIVDSFMVPFAAGGCHEKHIPHYQFVAAAAATILIYASMYEGWPVCPDEEGFALMEEMKPGEAPPALPAGFIKLVLANQAAMENMSGIIVNSCAELEEETMRLIKGHPKTSKLPVFTVGPLVTGGKVQPSHLTKTMDILRWMDGREKASVVYVSFGTLGWPDGKQIGEIVNALQLLKKPFIFSLRQTYHEFLPEDIRSKIATQFTDPDSQFLILDWAPQKEILAHPSTSLFISHCGWNSTLESLEAGVPVVAWPMFSDQKMNALALERLGTAVMLKDTGMKTGRLIQWEEIVKAVKTVLGMEKGTETFQARAEQMKAVVKKAISPGGSSYHQIEDLARF